MDMSQQPQGQATKRSQKYLHFQLRPGDQELIAQLPENQRVLLLSEGGYKERSEKWGVPIGTIRSRLHRARAALESLRQARDGVPNEEDAPLHS